MGLRDIYGTKVLGRKNKRSHVMYKKEGKLYKEMQDLTKVERAVLDYLVKHMAEGMNHVLIAGEFREDLLLKLGIAPKTLKRTIATLSVGGFIEKILLPNGYVINPLLAYSGNYDEVLRAYAKFEQELRNKRGINTKVNNCSNLDEKDI